MKVMGVSVAWRVLLHGLNASCIRAECVVDCTATGTDNLG